MSENQAFEINLFHSYLEGTKKASGLYRSGLSPTQGERARKAWGEWRWCCPQELCWFKLKGICNHSLNTIHIDVLFTEHTNIILFCYDRVIHLLVYQLFYAFRNQFHLQFCAQLGLAETYPLRRDTIHLTVSLDYDCCHVWLIK